MPRLNEGTSLALERQEVALKPQGTVWAGSRCHLVPGEGGG